MSELGIGVLVQMLGGNAESVGALQASLNKTIKSVELGTDDALHFQFEDGYGLKVFDDGQSCCERRYMRTDDDLTFFAGSIFLGLEVKQAPNEPDEWGEHEVQFLEVQTSKGCFTMASHNEHNGYYGGFYIKCSAELDQ